MEDPKTHWDLPKKEGEMNPAETPESPLPPASVIRAIAEHAQVDRKTVKKWLRRLPTRPRGAARIAAAVNALKLHQLAGSRTVAVAGGSQGDGRSPSR